jgi:hypothetical protein
VGEGRGCQVWRVDWEMLKGWVWAQALLSAEITLDGARLLGFHRREEVGGGLPEVLDLLGIVLASGAERETVDGDEGVICDGVDSVAVAKVGVESVPHADLHSSGETQIVVSRQTAYEFPTRLPRSRRQPAVCPVAKEYVPEAPVLVQPKVVAVFAVLLLRRLGRARRPLAPAIKQVAQEEDGVRVQNSLQARIGAAQVQIGVLVCERIERPRAAGVRVRVYELRVGDEDESVGVCASFLANLSAYSTQESVLDYHVPSSPTCPSCSSRWRC